MAPKTQNPRNPGSPLFKRLTRLFSGPLINYRAQFTREERRVDLDKYRNRFHSLSGQQFKRTHDNYGRNLNQITDMMRNQNRADRYIDFDQMEYTPEIASSLDIYADEMTTSNEYNKILNIECPNEEIEAVLESLFYNILNIEFNMFGWARTMCKYGDFFLYLDIDEAIGVQSVIGLPGNEFERLEGQDQTNSNYVQFQWNSAGLTLENWQVAHFRVLGNDKHAPYGTSVLEPARRIWRQLTLMEDAMLAYRVVRAPERRVFYIDVGNIAPEDVEQYMERVKTSMKRNQIVDADNGRVDLRYNPLSLEEDYYIPQRGGVSSRIESLPGAASLSDIEDVKYLRDKLFSALKVPMSYLSRGEGADEDKTTLAQKDIRFARTIQRLQRVMISELEKIGVVHLYTLGYRGQDLISFNLSLNNPSKIAELQELEHLRAKMDLANSVTEGLFSRHWVSRNIFNMSDDEFLRNQREIFYDKKYMTALEAVAEIGLAEEPGAPGALGPLGELPGEVPGLEGAEGEIPPGEELPELGTPESPLLAAPPEGAPPEPAPGRRESKPRRTPGDKGKIYRPVKTISKRTSTSGPRTRSYRSETNPLEVGTRRGLKLGDSGLSALANGIYENVRPNYNNEETHLLENSKQILDLITELEKKEKDTEKETHESEAQ